MANIIHIVAHLGGGAGKVLSSVAIYSQQKKLHTHTIITLEKTKTAHFERICKDNDVSLFLASDCDIDKILINADIVQVDWWHHPLVSEWIVKKVHVIPMRLVIWSHISGCSYPYIPASIPLLPDFFIFSSPYSLENHIWSEIELKTIKKNSSVVVSSALTQRKIEHISTKNFVVGYVGFLGYSKIHPNFVKFCEAASDIPNIHFEIVGDTFYGKQLIEDMNSSKKLQGKFSFSGYCENISEKLATFDVLGYPLTPEHTGTAENALLEAMAAGVPPIVLDQNSERYTVTHKKTGCCVQDAQEYGAAIRWLYSSPEVRAKLGENAAQFVQEEFSLSSTVNKLQSVYAAVLKKSKSTRDGTTVLGKTPVEWCMSCFCGDRTQICGLAMAKTKGSIRQYARYFPNDLGLKMLIKQNVRV